MASFNQYKFILSLFLGLVMVGCSEMDDMHEEFLGDGPIVYPGKADSVQTFSGRDRLLLTWLASTDPKVQKATVLWENQEQSLDVPLQGYTPGVDTVEVYFENLSEGDYVFEIYTFDDKGNRSVKVEALGRVFGDNYEQSLLSRPIDEVRLEGEELHVTWGSVPDGSAIGSEVDYVGLDGQQMQHFTPGDVPTSVIPNFGPQTFRHRTLYLPTETAIDTFYTAYATEVVKGPPILLWEKSNWNITASSEDVNGGRIAQNLIDGNLSNLFVNQLGVGLTYPHHVTIDMNETVADVEGFYFYQRNLNPLRTLEVHISQDGENWENLGHYTIDRTNGEPVFLQLPEPQTFRYFKQIYHDDYGNSNNVNIHEMGIYIRE